jgi:hypothetical protein
MDVFQQPDKKEVIGEFHSESQKFGCVKKAYFETLNTCRRPEAVLVLREERHA